jgi:hypothetical protein
MLATIPWMVVLFVCLFVFRRQGWGIVIPIPAIIALGVFIFMAFEKVVVYERCGFRCKGCGYDLRGQTEPCCPECGRRLDEDEIGQMKAARPEETVQVVRGGRVRRWVAVIALIIAALLVVLQVLHLFRLRSGRSSVPETQVLLNNVLAFAEYNDGQEPRHGLEHSGGDYLLFIARDSATVPVHVPVPGGNLFTFHHQTYEKQRDTTVRAIKSLPPGTIAHRLGDFVLVYHGIDFEDADPGLWLVIRSLDPGQNPPPQAKDRLAVGLADGTVIEFRVRDLAQKLARQNALRARQGLPLLPDPATVTHQAPAVAKP